MKEKFELLVEKYADMITRICFLGLKNKADAEDAWQNTFIKLYKHNEILEKPDEEIRKWLCTVALNECRDIKRKLFHRNHLDIDELQVTYTARYNRDLIEAVKALPQKYLEVIELYYFEGYRINQIADILSEKENTIKSRLKRGRELLKGVLSDE